MITITLSRADLEILEDAVWNAQYDLGKTVKEYEKQSADSFIVDQIREKRSALKGIDKLLFEAMCEHDEKVKRGEQND